MQSNFAVLMDLLGVSPQQLAVEIGTDTTLVSRWRTGGRKLVAGRHWVKKIAVYFIQLDAAERKANGKTILKLLTAFYPADAVDDAAEQQQLLERWLCAPNQFTDIYQKRRTQILSEAFSAPKAGAQEAARPIRADDGGVQLLATGQKAVREAILEMIDKSLDLPAPCQIWFVCPEGLNLLTEDETFGTLMMNRLMRMFKFGHRLNVVLRTDFKMSEVSYFSGRWLLAHLLGYVQSFYYDDFRKIKDHPMMAVFENKIAMRVQADKRIDVKGEFTYGGTAPAALLKELEPYFDLSTRRFHYDLFTNPKAFLRDISRITNDSYQFAAVPLFSLRGEAQLNELNLADEERALIKAEFALMLRTPESLPGDVYHIYCIDEIEKALDAPRRMVPELQQMLGHRVFMPTQQLVDNLQELHRLNQNPNFHLCFLTAQQLERLGMQLCVWGNEAAVGWLPHGSSTACRDFITVGALHGFCATIWNRIPGLARSKSAANKKLNAWLKRVKKFGYTVN